jgi:hypothetical protein
LLEIWKLGFIATLNDVGFVVVDTEPREKE